MMNRLFGKEDYEVTLDEFKREMDKALQSLIGIDVMQNGGIGKLVEKATEDVVFGSIECDHTMVKVYCPSLGEYAMEEFGRVRWTYKADKRKSSGVGTRIEEIHFEYTIDTDKVEDYVCNISQVLTYDKAEQKKAECEASIEALERRIAELKSEVDKYEDVMRYNRYR